MCKALPFRDEGDFSDFSTDIYSSVQPASSLIFFETCSDQTSIRSCPCTACSSNECDDKNDECKMTNVRMGKF